MKSLLLPLLPILLLASGHALSQGYGQPDYSQQSGYPPASTSPYPQDASPYPQAPAASPYPQVPAASPYPQAPAASPYPQNSSPYPDPSAGAASPYPQVGGIPGQSLPGDVSQQSPVYPGQGGPMQTGPMYPQSGQMNPPGYPASALQGQQLGGMSASPGWTPPQAVQPVTAVSSGPCGVKLSTDRSTLYLTDPANGVERKQLSLGSDRVQRVFTSPDKAWSVAIYKVRGVSQFGFIALDLTACEDQMPVELPALVTAASFDNGEVVLKLEKGATQRFPLQNARVQ